MKKVRLFFGQAGPRPGSLRLTLACVLWTGWLILTLALPALADIAPPERPPGSSISPAGPTQVRMLAERVVIDIHPDEPDQDNSLVADDRAEAQVSATFLMRNVGQADEPMQVRFPLEVPDERGGMAQVEGFTASVNGQPAVITSNTGQLRANGPIIQWAGFEVIFPIGQDITIEVAYHIKPTGYLPIARFGYLLETGAGWQGSIGSIDIITRLPYPTSAENVLLGPNRSDAGATYQTTPGGQFVGNEVHWHWENLEPTAANNFFINILVPQTWQSLVQARAAVEAAPDDQDALLTLAQAYENAVGTRFPTENNDPYASLSELTYARAIALQPDSVELRTQLARLRWDHLMVQYLLPPDNPHLPSILAQLNQALAIDPHYEPALTLLAEIKAAVTEPWPPAPPVRAWTITASGEVFVLDAANILHQLAPTSLTPLAQSAPLFPAQPDNAPVYLLADTARLYVANQAISQTLVLEQDDFSQITTLPHAGPMALDPDRHLFLISAATSQLLAYNPANLSQPPQVISVYCIPVDLAADPIGRRLYIRAITSCGSSHHSETYYVYNLDTLAEISRVSGAESLYGTLGRPVAIEGTDLGAGVYYPYASSPQLLTFDREGRFITKKELPYLDKVALAAYGDRLYLCLKRGLAVMRVGDLSLQSFLPFTATVPSDLALSPDGEMLYLLGDRLTAYSTAELKALGMPPVRPFPLTWTQEMDSSEATEVRVYPSPDVTQDNVVFAQLLPAGDPLRAEVYRSDDGGHSWRSFPVLSGPGTALSLSPDFARDQTLVTDYRRSTDGGATWTSWTPRLAFVSEREGNREIYTMNELGDDLQRLTHHSAADENPAWSPAWARLAFQSNRSGNWDLFTLRAECAPAQAECDLHQLTDDPADDLLPAWSPDGRRIAFVSIRDGNPEIYVMDHDGQHQRRLTFNPSGDWRPAWLPDSQRLVFTSDRNGNNDIYLLTVPQDTTPLITEPPLIPIVISPADDRDPTIGGSSLLSTYFDFDFGPAGFLFFLSDRDGTMKTYVTLPDGSATLAERWVEVNQVEAHPSWFKEYTVLVAMGPAGESEIYGLTPFSPAKALTASPGFDGQPAGGPVWWRPDKTTSLGWLMGRP